MVIGYVFTLIYIALFLGLIASLYKSRREIAKAFSGKIDRNTIVAALLITAFFVAFSLLYVHPVEQLYFDENIYQGIALNILHNGNAAWCQYGTGYLASCPYSSIYHDPAEPSFYMAIAFAIFGIGTSTAYGLQLAIGAISIMLVFLLGSLLFGKKAGVASAIIFALIPELFIWSRTQAVPNLGLMMFTILAFLAYSIYRERRSNWALYLFLSALGIAVYMRIEAILLIPIFTILEITQHNFGALKKQSISRILSNIWESKLLVPILLFAIAITPQLYYIHYEGQTLDYGQGTICGNASNSTFSVANFNCNVLPNTNFFFGLYNQISYYPAYFSVFTTAIAIIGLLMLVFSKMKRGGYYVLLLGLWILVFHLFYDFFYAGSVTYGVDVRFMLIIYPPLALLGGFGIAKISEALPEISGASKRRKRILSALIYAALISVFALFPFYNALSITTIPYHSMPQETVPLAAVNFIYNNYNSVPPNCLVFSFTPDIWYELNYSSAQVGDFGSADPNFTAFESRFSCFVFDKGYWCTIGSYSNGLCKSDIANDNATVLASNQTPYNTGNFSLYLLRGYKP